MVEAGRLQGEQDEFIAETGLGFSFLFVLSEGSSGQPITAEDIEAYYENNGAPVFPMLGDFNYALAAATPMEAVVRPEMCALTPEFEILACDAGHGSHKDLFAVIREHAGIE